jgi:hypothetical protein
VKVLDFGLAKAVDDDADGASALNSPTVTAASVQDVILGTASYMSPEQASGRAVDRRTDLFAFGGVVFEMLTGRQAFAGATASHILAAVLTQSPDLAALPAATPAPIRTLLRRCFEKDRKCRLAHAADARLEIDDAIAGFGTAVVAVTPSIRRSVRALPWIVATAAIVAAALALRTGRGPAPASLHAAINAPDGWIIGDAFGVTTSLPTRTPMVFTPDGRALVMQASHDRTTQLVLRTLDRSDPRPIAGTENARLPFVSPDGKWIGFWSGNELRKVSIDGGDAIAICPLPAVRGPYGAVWTPDGSIVFGDESGRLMRVAATGGTPEPVSSEPPLRHRFVQPSLMPDGHRILFTDTSTEDATQARLMIQPLNGGGAREVLTAAVDGRVLPSGDLAFMRLGTLMTVAFDADRGIVRGEPTTVARVMQSGARGLNGADITAAGMYAVSNSGMLAFIRGGMIDPGTSSLIWLTKDGQASKAAPDSSAPPGRTLRAWLSPDGLRALVTLQTPLRRELAIVDWRRGVWTACADCQTPTGFAIWSPDGERVLLARDDAIVEHTLDGSRPDRAVVQESQRSLYPTGWLKDGRIAYLASIDATTSRTQEFEIKTIAPGEASGRVAVALARRDAAVSPDGRWVAYSSSREQGAGSVMVSAFPGPGARVQVSSGDAWNPAWSADGRTLYYVQFTPGAGVGALVAIDVTPGRTFVAGAPRELFRRADLVSCVPTRCYDVAPDGRFLTREVSSVARETAAQIELVVNWAPARDKNGILR